MLSETNIMVLHWRKIMVTPKMASRRPAKRILKPIIEKKRRDRINQRLDELRTLLLDNTLDSRLQNPKLEKAEILELTVEYIRTKATAARDRLGDSNKDSDPHDANAPTLLSTRPHVPFASVPESISVQKQMPSNPIYKAGFNKCVSRLASFIECVEPSQRDGFVQGLCHHLDSYSSTLSQCRVSSQAAHHPWIPNAELTCRTDVPAIGPMRANAEPFSYTNSLYPQSFMLHPTGQAMPHPYLSPPYSLSPPPSPCYSSSSPTYLSVPCHFPFPPTISPLSSDSSSSSFSLSTPAVPIVPGPHVQVGSPTRVRPTVSTPSCQPRTLRRALFHSQPQSVWRPW
ncbi:transcription factor HES-7-like isoform X2 [Sinocyclocheilus anshuiensis]|uniref:Transcription factor HES-7-like n=2 Tax=Sinocyclocheilus anshuiensis TaxID=1608454 RepID=A0A671KSW2_9TELE|nr:PREDICTED: transcription factor HES-7-like isoform X2 [Sinocyclocheilus anshuiensis]